MGQRFLKELIRSETIYSRMTLIIQFSTEIIFSTYQNEDYNKK